MVLSFVDITVFVEITEVVMPVLSEEIHYKKNSNDKNFFVKFCLILYQIVKFHIKFNTMC